MIILFYDPNSYRPDVNQFSIITELLGTPPDDVIETIASENVGVSSIYERIGLKRCLLIDSPLCKESAQARPRAVRPEVEDK